MPRDAQPLLWGQWEPAFHASGTCMVLLTPRNDARPHLYVFADPMPEDPQRGQRNRRVMCRMLADWMSGREERPLWLDDFEPRRESAGEAITGALIVATGPWLRRKAVPGQYRQDQSPESQRARRLLIATVLGRSPDAWV
jgi:hypothetical protein